MGRGRGHEGHEVRRKTRKIKDNFVIFVSRTPSIHMICPKCGFTASATDHFCENCGAALSKAAANINVSAAQTCHCPPGQSKPDEDGYCQVCGVRCIPEDVAARKH